MTVQEIKDRVHRIKARSAWDRGVLTYADELLNDLEEATRK